MKVKIILEGEDSAVIEIEVTDEQFEFLKRIEEAFEKEMEVNDDYSPHFKIM